MGTGNLAKSVDKHLSATKSEGVSVEQPGPTGTPSVTSESPTAEAVAADPASEVAPTGGRARRTGGLLAWAGLALLVVGAVLGSLSIAMAFPSINFAGFTFARPLTVPSETERSLAPDTYVIFQSVSPLNAYTTLGPEHVSITGPSGAVPVSPMTATETVTFGESEYLGALQFDIETAGTYTISINPATRTEVLIMPSLTTTFVGIAGWVVLGVLASVVFYVGALVLVVGLVWRSTAPMLEQSGAQTSALRAQLAAEWMAEQPAAQAQQAQPVQAQPYPPQQVPPQEVQPQPVQTQPYPQQPAQQPLPTDAAPAGWYVDPGQPNRWRYWDGGHWTAHHS